MVEELQGMCQRHASAAAMGDEVLGQESSEEVVAPHAKAEGKELADEMEREARSSRKFADIGNGLYRTEWLPPDTSFTASARITGTECVDIGLESKGGGTEYLLQLEQRQTKFKWTHEELSGRTKELGTGWLGKDAWIKVRVSKQQGVNFGVATEGGDEYLLDLNERCPDSRWLSEGDTVTLSWNHTDRSVGWMMGPSSYYPVLASSTKSTGRVRFFARVEVGSSLALIDAPAGSCCCDDEDVCIKREHCIDDGETITLKWDANETKGYLYTAAGGAGWAYMIYKGVSLPHVRVVARVRCDSGRVDDMLVLTDEEKFKVNEWKQGGVQSHAGTLHNTTCLNDDILSGKTSCESGVCCGNRCQGVCKNCYARLSKDGGYCMCYPRGYLHNGKHVEKDGACKLPPGEDGPVIPSMDADQPEWVTRGAGNLYCPDAAGQAMGAVLGSLVGEAGSMAVRVVVTSHLGPQVGTTLAAGASKEVGNVVRDLIVYAMGTPSLTAVLKATVEPYVQERGLEWEDVEPLFETLDSAEKLSEAVNKPSAYLGDLAKAAGGQLAKKLTKAYLKPKLEPYLQKQGYEWSAVESALEIIDIAQSIEDIGEKQGFLEQLAAAGTLGIKSFAVMRLKPALEPLLEEQGLDWDDVVPILSRVNSLDTLRAGENEPEAFLAQLLASEPRGGARANGLGHTHGGHRAALWLFTEFTGFFLF
jgi:hypothetical protein